MVRGFTLLELNTSSWGSFNLGRSTSSAGGIGVWPTTKVCPALAEPGFLVSHPNLKLAGLVESAGSFDLG